MIDIILLIIFAVVTWCVASEGAWGAALMLLTVLFSGLLAMNFFEPFANFLESNFSNSPDWMYRWDIIALIGLFAAFVMVIRTILENLLPTFIIVQPITFEAVRWTCGVATGYVVMAFFLTSLHTAPLPREFIGFKPERRNFLNFSAPDRQWLGFTQYVSERVFPNDNIFDGPTYRVNNPKYPFPDQLLSAKAPSGEVERMPVWPAFPIRYASRRDELATGSGPVVDAAPAAGGAGGPATRPNF